MVLYKLTDAHMRTCAKRELIWKVGESQSALGKGTTIGTDAMIRVYEHPLIAVLMNPIHEDFDPATMRLFVAEGEIIIRQSQLQCGVRTLKLIEEIPVPILTLEQLVKFALLSHKEVCDDPDWNTWADDWLSGRDRSFTSVFGDGIEAFRAAYTAQRVQEASQSATARAAWLSAATTRTTAQATAEEGTRASQIKTIDFIRIVESL
jgi:hypothetical protein